MCTKKKNGSLAPEYMGSEACEPQYYPARHIPRDFRRQEDLLAYFRRLAKRLRVILRNTRGKMTCACLTIFDSYTRDEAHLPAAM